MTPDQLNLAIAESEKRVQVAARKLSRMKDPRKKLMLMWNLAYIELRDLEDFRPAGGFTSAPKLTRK